MALEIPKIKNDPELLEQAQELLKDLEELNNLFEDYVSAGKKRFSKVRRAKVVAKLTKRVYGLRRKYKNVVDKINEVMK